MNIVDEIIEALGKNARSNVITFGDLQKILASVKNRTVAKEIPEESVKYLGHIKELRSRVGISVGATNSPLYPICKEWGLNRETQYRFQEAIIDFFCKEIDFLVKEEKNRLFNQKIGERIYQHMFNNW